MPYVEMGGFPRRATLEGKIEESASHHVIKCNEIALETIRILFHMHFPLNDIFFGNSLEDFDFSHFLTNQK